MTTTTDLLSPERVKDAEAFIAAEIGAQRELLIASKDAGWPNAVLVHSTGVAIFETLAALARAHIDATKREPPAGLVEVIAQQIVATFPGSPQLPSAIARAVGAFATSDAAVTKALVAWFPDYEDDYPREAARTTAEEDDQYRGEMRAAIRAALGATEESE